MGIPFTKDTSSLFLSCMDAREAMQPHLSGRDTILASSRKQLKFPFPRLALWKPKAVFIVRVPSNSPQSACKLHGYRKTQLSWCMRKRKFNVACWFNEAILHNLTNFPLWDLIVCYSKNLFFPWLGYTFILETSNLMFDSNKKSIQVVNATHWAHLQCLASTLVIVLTILSQFCWCPEGWW